MAAGEAHTVALRSDGAVVAVGRNTQRQLNVSDWNDIVAVAAGAMSTVGLRADGTVVAAGAYSGIRNISDWQIDWRQIALDQAGRVKIKSE